jgi:phosphoribosyl 1,2-cyclic phosphodiesterase
LDKLRFISLASGSSGNCYFVGTGSFGILIDAGIGVRTIRKRLKNVGIPFEHVAALFITHDHADHIRAAGNLGENYHIPVYATQTIHDGIQRSYAVTEKIYNSKRVFDISQPVSIFDFTIEAFPVSHDASQSVGYTIHYKGKRFTIATDLGYICENAARHISQANYLVVEANYDEQMLREGRYPVYLKNRVASEYGHMCNKETALFLKDNYHAGLEYIYLCHLSNDNNTPQKAYDEVKTSLQEIGVEVEVDVQLLALERTKSSKLFIY